MSLPVDTNSTRHSMTFCVAMASPSMVKMTCHVDTAAYCARTGQLMWPDPHCLSRPLDHAETDFDKQSRLAHV